MESFLTTTTNSDFVVGEPLNLTVAIELPGYDSKTMGTIYVEPDDALSYSATKGVSNYFAFLFV